MASRSRLILSSCMRRICSPTPSPSSSDLHHRCCRSAPGSHFARAAPSQLPHPAASPIIAPRATGWLLQARSMSCCAGTGSPPPREIVVEYCESSYTDDFIKLANEIEEAFPEFLVSGNPDGAVKPREGAFEIKSGDSILFSKLKTNRMPELAEVLKAIDSLPPAECPL